MARLIHKKKGLKSISKIEFTQEGASGKPDYTLVIYCDRTIVLNAVKNNFTSKYEGDTVPYGTGTDGGNIRGSEIKGIFKAKLSRNKFKEVIDLINSLQKEFEQQNYDNNSLHSSVGILKITDKKGLVKSIHDNGLNGTERLVKLYNELDNLRLNLDWK